MVVCCVGVLVVCVMMAPPFVVWCVGGVDGVGGVGGVGVLVVCCLGASPIVVWCVWVLVCGCPCMCVLLGG